MKHEYLVCIAIAMVIAGTASSSQPRDEQGEALFAAVKADILLGSQGVNHAIGRAYLYYGPFETTTDIPFTWDTTNASIATHTLRVEMPPVPGEQNTEDNVKTVTIEVKEPAG